MPTTAAAIAPSPYVSQDRNERRPISGMPLVPAGGGLETGSMIFPLESPKSSLSAGRLALPPGRQQRHQVVDLWRGQRAEILCPSVRAVVGRHPDIGPAGDDDAPQRLVTDQRQEVRVIDLAALPAVTLHAHALRAVAAGAGAGKH